MSITDDLLAELPDDVAAEIRGEKKKPAAVANGQRSNVSTVVSSEGPFATARALSTSEVCDRLGIEHDEKFAVCPGCKEPGAAISLDRKQGLKCLHARCAGRGRNGYRSNVDLVMEVRGGTDVEACNWLAGQFGFAGVPPRSVSNAAPNGSPPPPAGEGPTADDPLRGLARLAAVAIVGKDRILELAARQVVYIWQDIALTGIVVVIAGGPGSGKTTLLFLLLAARANLGKPVKVLGREVTPAPVGTYVVLIEAEHGDSSTARKLVKSCRLLGVDDSALERVIVIARRCVRIGSPEWQEVGHMVAAGLVSDIALDTLARVAPADANNEQEQVAIFDQVAQTIERAPSTEPRPAVWTVVHTRKDETNGLADVSGSTQRTGQADSVLMVRAEKADGRVTSSRVTFAKLREEPDEYPAPFEYTVTTAAVVDVDRPAEDNRPLEVRITERLALGPRTKSALARELKMGKTPALEEAISNMFTARHIVSTDVTIKGVAYKGFALRPGSTWEPS